MTAFVPTGHLTLSAAIECVAAIIQGEKREAQQTLRQLLYNGRVPSQTIERSGQTFDTPAYVWGGEQWRKVLQTGRVRFDYSYNGDVHGRVFIPEAALKTALNSYGVTTGATEQAENIVPITAKKTETRQRDEDLYKLFKDTGAAHPRKKQGQIFGLMRAAQPNLFTNRRGAAKDKKISDQAVARIIRKQQKQ